MSQNEEAAVAVGGGAPLSEPDIPDILLFDSGGGSTGSCWLKTQPAGAAGAGSVAGQAPELSLYAWLSVPIGVITLSERYGTERYCTGRKVSGADAAQSYRPLEAELAAAVAGYVARTPAIGVEAWGEMGV